MPTDQIILESDHEPSFCKNGCDIVWSRDFTLKFGSCVVAIRRCLATLDMICNQMRLLGMSIATEMIEDRFGIKLVRDTRLHDHVEMEFRTERTLADAMDAVEPACDLPLSRYYDVDAIRQAMGAVQTCPTCGEKLRRGPLHREYGWASAYIVGPVIIEQVCCDRPACKQAARSLAQQQADAVKEEYEPWRNARNQFNQTKKLIRERLSGHRRAAKKSATEGS